MWSLEQFVEVSLSLPLKPLKQRFSRAVLYGHHKDLRPGKSSSLGQLGTKS
jgi:hypothetical protein